MLREATDPPAAVNVLDVSSESMAAFQVFTYGRFWVFTEERIIVEARLLLSPGTAKPFVEWIVVNVDNDKDVLKKTRRRFRGNEQWGRNKKKRSGQRGATIFPSRYIPHNN
jgi:hypothetical protein